MRNRIFGGIGVLWGGAVCVNALLNGGPKGQGAALAGAWTGTVLAILLFTVGLYYLVMGDKAGKRP